MQYPLAKIIELKILYDKSTIIGNEILNFFSVNSFFNKKVQKLFLIEEIESIEKRLRRRVKEDVERFYYSHRLKELLNFPRRLVGKNGEKLFRKEELETSSHELWYLFWRTRYLRFYIEEILNKTFSPTQELMIFSYFYKELQEILKAVKVNAYVLKFRKENAYQSYVPSPLLHRRFRIYNSHLFLNLTIQKVLKKFVKKNKNMIRNESLSFLLTADYDVGALVDDYTEKGRALVMGDFFWRELDAFQPIIIHEIFHKIPLEESFQKGKNEVIQKISTIIQTSPVSFASNRDMLQKTIDDMVVDAMAYHSLGDSYLLSLVFGGLWGFYYFDTLHGPSKGNKLSLKYVPTAVNFSSFREKAIIRLIFLIGLREKLRNEKLIVNEADEILPQVVHYINDLFPIENEKGESFNRLSELNKQSVALISSLCKYISNIVLNFISNKFYNPFNRKLKPVGIFDDKVKISLSGKKAVFINTSYENCQIKLSEREKHPGLEIKLEEKEKLVDKKEINVFNLMWYYTIRHFKKFENGGQDVLQTNIPMGRINIIYMLISLYGPILEKLVQNYAKSIKLGIDELVIVKVRKRFTQGGKYNLFNFYKSMCERIKRFNFNKGNNIASTCFFSTGFYDLVFLKGRDISGKEDEIEFYSRLISSSAYVDRHPFIIVDEENYANIRINHPFSGFILTQLKDQFLTEVDLTKDVYLPCLDNNRGIMDPKVDPTKDKELNKLFEKYISKRGFTLLGFSMGWEDLIFFLNAPLKRIFKSWDLHAYYPNIVKRTETIIVASFEQKKTVRRNTSDRYVVQINLRCENNGPEFKSEFREFIKNLKNLGRRISVTHIPGRFDINLINEEKIDEGGVLDFIERFLRQNFSDQIIIDDYYIRIQKLIDPTLQNDNHSENP